MANSTKNKAERSKLGSKKQVKPGVWQIRVSAGYKKDGSQRRASRTIHGTERDADMAIARLADEMGRRPTLGDSYSLDDYFWGKFVPGREVTTTITNVKNHIGNYRNHIEPYFGQWDIGEIDNRAVQQWIYGLPPQSAPCYVRTLRAVLNQARFDHVIDTSPMADFQFKMPRGRKTAPLPVWGVQEVADCLMRLEGNRLYPLWLVMVGGGLSRSEAHYNDWEDIKWVRITDIDGEGHWTAYVPVTGACVCNDGMKEPKNDRRYRTAPIRPIFADPLHEYVSTGPLLKSMQGTRLSPGYIDVLWKKLFDEGQPLEGMPFVGMNRMRATYATLMQEAGVESSIINAMQGRSKDSPILYTNYLNPGKSTFVAAAGKMEKLVTSA